MDDVVVGLRLGGAMGNGKGVDEAAGSVTERGEMLALGASIGVGMDDVGAEVQGGAVAGHVQVGDVRRAQRRTVDRAERIARGGRSPRV